MTFATRGVTALHGRGRIQENGRRHRQVQRLGLAIDRNPHHVVARLEHVGSESPCLVSHHPRVGSGQVHVAEQRLPGTVGGQQRKTGATDAIQQVRDGHTCHDRQVEQRPNGRSNHLGVVDVDAGVAEQDGVGSSRIGAADDGPGIAGVADVGQDHQEPRSQLKHHVEGDIDGPTDCDDPLRDQGVAHGAENVGADLTDAQASRLRHLQHDVMPASRLNVDVQILDRIRTVRDDLANGLWTFGKEQSFTLTHRAPAQRPH